LLPLCEELDVTVNELLTGERVSEEDYRKKAEENMVNLVKEAQEMQKEDHIIRDGYRTYPDRGDTVIFNMQGWREWKTRCGSFLF